MTLWAVGFCISAFAAAGRSSAGSGFGLIVGLFGGGYSNSTATTFIEREEYDDTNCDTYDNCDNCDN